MKKIIVLLLTFCICNVVNTQGVSSRSLYKGIPWGTSLQYTSDFFLNSGDSIIVAEGTVGCYLSKYLDYDITVFCNFTGSDELASIVIYFDRDKIKPYKTYELIEQDLIKQYGQLNDKHDYKDEKDANREEYIKTLDSISASLQDERFTKWISPEGDEIKLSLTLNQTLSIQYNSSKYKFVYNPSTKQSYYIRVPRKTT